MKFLAYSAIVGFAYAALGDDCYYDAKICDADNLKCATWEDSQYGPMASCEDCSEGNKQIEDSYGDKVEYQCPNMGGGGGSGPAPTPDSANTIAVSAAVLLAASTLLA
jgi:hypothetical protein